jgi:hypothetical protein
VPDDRVKLVASGWMNFEVAFSCQPLEAEFSKQGICTTLKIRAGDQFDFSLLNLLHTTINLRIPLGLDRYLIRGIDWRHGVFALKVTQQMIHIAWRETPNLLFDVLNGD